MDCSTFPPGISNSGNVPSPAANSTWPTKRPVGKKIVQQSRVSFGASGTVRKQGDEYKLRRELEAMDFVRRETSIPIPRVLESHFDPNGNKDGSWILMEKLSGSQMGIAWPSMTEQARARTLEQLRSHLEQLHKLHPPGDGWIGSCSHGPAYDHRIDNMVTCGPFESVSEFHDYLVAPVKNCPKPDAALEYRKLLPDTCTITFAHADLSWENILVEPETGEITGIIDWEMAGFWPEWWEYRKALSGCRPQPWWFEVLKSVMREYPRQTEVDMDLEMY